MLYEGCILKTTQLHSFLTILSILVSRLVRYVCMHIKKWGSLVLSHFFVEWVDTFHYNIFLFTRAHHLFISSCVKKHKQNLFISYFIYFFMRIRHKIGSALGAELKVSKGFKELKRVRKMPRSAVV